MVQQLRMACLGGLLAALVSSAATAAASKAMGVDGPGGGELVPVQPKGAGQELESSFEIGPASSEEATDAVGFSGCVAPFKTVSHRVSLAAR
jgi:hypothetical protein